MLNPFRVQIGFWVMSVRRKFGRKIKVCKIEKNQYSHA
ncbi:hypothetical protein E2C01_042917 [Portunus trituberculatus]|uniref:Uncharacterized protein n=1 Tax=Portunus trituberculatus TaxID=210409 RepID=A0A5B7FVY2_PORTR|nr:hypothetical protein [Portunus trituberculatus]